MTRARKRYTIVADCYDSRGRMISSATNSYTKSHPIQAHFASLVGEPARIYLHAEILALLRAGANKVHTLKITNLSGGLSHPCKICQAAIKSWGIQRVISQ